MEKKKKKKKRKEKNEIPPVTAHNTHAFATIEMNIDRCQMNTARAAMATNHSINVHRWPNRPSPRLPASTRGAPGMSTLSATSHQARRVIAERDATSGFRIVGPIKLIALSRTPRADAHFFRQRMPRAPPHIRHAPPRVSDQCPQESGPHKGPRLLHRRSPSSQPEYRRASAQSTAANRARRAATTEPGSRSRAALSPTRASPAGVQPRPPPQR